MMDLTEQPWSTGPLRGPFVVTESMAPDTIRVYAGEPPESDIVCTIRNLSLRPIASWGTAWQALSPDWQRLLTVYAIQAYRTCSGDIQLPREVES